ncbi:hypothetical protein AB0L05_16465 [Nonomuraea pusilla]|uniref:hypothetical protein n=1 Tax=Nonomuraea pusilla TaxID=46177 RepID=UPI00332C6F1B
MTGGGCDQAGGRLARLLPPRTRWTCAQASTRKNSSLASVSTPATARTQARTSANAEEARCARLSACPTSRSPPDAGTYALSSPSPSVSVVARYPSRSSLVSSRSTASTVWARSPPASCIITTAPRPLAGVPALTMAGTPGRLQSLVSRSVRATR